MTEKQLDMFPWRLWYICKAKNGKAKMLKLLEETEDWHAFAMKLEMVNSFRMQFIDLSIIYVPRLNNVDVDILAKGARARGTLFSHVTYIIPEWLPHKTTQLEQA